MIPIVAEQGANLLANLSSYYEDAASSLGQIRQFSSGFGISEYIAFVLQSFEQMANAWSTEIFSTATSFVGGAAALLIILVLTFYMVAEEEGFGASIQYLVPVEYQPYMKLLLKKLKRKMGAWLRGQLILSLIVGSLVYIGLSILGIRYALLLALLDHLIELLRVFLLEPKHLVFIPPFMLPLLPALMQAFSWHLFLFFNAGGRLAHSQIKNRQNTQRNYCCS